MPQNFFVFIHLDLGHKLFSVYYTACFVKDIWTRKKRWQRQRYYLWDWISGTGGTEWEHNGGNNGAGGDGSWEEVAGRPPRSTRAGLCPLKHPQPYLQPFLILDLDYNPPTQLYSYIWSTAKPWQPTFISSLSQCNVTINSPTISDWISHSSLYTWLRLKQTHSMTF